MNLKDLAIVVLAAGKGTRMRSDKAKVLHPLDGRPMIQYVVSTASQLVQDRVIVVIGHQAEAVRTAVSTIVKASFAIQHQQLGTAHAVKCAMEKIAISIKAVLVLCGDVPLISTKTLKQFYNGHIASKRDISVLCVRMDDPTGYGRIITDSLGRFTGIVEERDSTALERAIKYVNTGIYCISRALLNAELDKVNCANSQGEYYLTDIIQIAQADGFMVGVEECQCIDEVVGVNTLEDLQRVENLLISASYYEFLFH